MGVGIHFILQAFINNEWTIQSLDKTDDFYSDYHFFSVLSGTCNGYSPFGYVLGEQWPVLYWPKGIPKDIVFDEKHEDDDDAFDNTYQENYLGECDHSWLTLKELIKIRDHLDGQQYTNIAWVFQNQKKHFEETGQLPEITQFFGTKNVVPIIWSQDCLEKQDKLLQIITFCEHLAQTNKIGYNDIRLVFGYDGYQKPTYKMTQIQNSIHAIFGIDTIDDD